jgi:UDP-4-amino-4,6-dideoxy-N-acetyl-beta-L-altrosamine transaminase
VGNLAIDGGAPVRARLLPYGHQVIDADDTASVLRVLESDWLTTGPEIELFEQALAGVAGVPETIAVSNGTAALHAAAAALDIGPGDEVIVPVMTFAASANCVRYQGGTVVFADVCPDTLTIDPAAAAALVTKRTKAIVAVDYTGQPCDYDELASLARQHGLRLIADAAHALGASYRGRPAGTLADLTTFSFHPVKHITTGEGGAVATADPALAARVRRFRSHGIISNHREREERGAWVYEMVELGYNYRMTDFQCALGRAQLAKLPGWIARRRAIAARYAAALAGLAEVEAPVERADRQSAWHLYVVRLALDRLRVGRPEVFRALRAENIGVNVHYIPVPWHPYYQGLGYKRGSWPVAEAEYERLLSLPMWAGMTDNDMDDVVLALEKVCTEYRR